MEPRKKSIVPIILMIIFLALAAALIYFLFRAASRPEETTAPSISEVFKNGRRSAPGRRGNENRSRRRKRHH